MRRVVSGLVAAAVAVVVAATPAAAGGKQKTAADVFVKPVLVAAVTWFVVDYWAGQARDAAWDRIKQSWNNFRQDMKTWNKADDPGYRNA